MKDAVSQVMVQKSVQEFILRSPSLVFNIPGSSKMQADKPTGASLVTQA